jgi:hypothetical protein
MNFRGSHLRLINFAFTIAKKKTTEAHTHDDAITFYLIAESASCDVFGIPDYIVYT